MAFPQTDQLVFDSSEYSDVNESRLILSYTRSDYFTYTFVPDPAVPDSTNSLGGSVLLTYLTNPLLTNVGDADTNSTGPNFPLSICTSRRLVVDAPNAFHLVYTFEAASANTVWEDLGNVQAELWNYDKDGTLLQIPFVPVVIPYLPGVIPGLPGGVNYQIPHIPNLPRYISVKVLRRTRMLSSNAPNLDTPLGTNNSAFGAPDISRDNFIDLYEGSVNSTDWFNFRPRQVLCASIKYTTQNNYTVMETCEFWYRQRTWDEFGIYLSAENKRLIGTNDLPPPPVGRDTAVDPDNNIVTSTKGMKVPPDDANGNWNNNPNTGANGWIRAKMMPEQDFTFDFDPTTDTK